MTGFRRPTPSPRSRRERGARSRGSREQTAVAQIQAEHRPRRGSQRPDDRRELTGIPQGLRPHDDPRGAPTARALGVSRRGRPGVEPHVEAEAGEGRDHRPVIADPGDGVEIGDIAFPRAQSLHEGAAEGERLRRRGQDALHGRVGVALSAEGVHRLASLQIEHGDHSQHRRRHRPGEAAPDDSTRRASGSGRGRRDGSGGEAV